MVTECNTGSRILLKDCTNNKGVNENLDEKCIYKGTKGQQKRKARMQGNVTH